MKYTAVFVILVKLIFAFGLPAHAQLNIGIDTSLEKSKVHLTLRKFKFNPSYANVSFKDEKLIYSPTSLNNSLSIWNKNDTLINWQAFNYLIVQVIQKASFSGIIYIEFFGKKDESNEIIRQGGDLSYSKIKPAISAKVGILPNLETQIIVPLSYLDGQTVFSQKFPRQLKSSIFGRRLSPEDITEVRLRVEPFQSPDYTPAVEIISVYVSKNIPGPLPALKRPVVDKFGQWTDKEWPGKIKTEKELITKFNKLDKANQNTSFQKTWSEYGGDMRKQFSGTGYFSTRFDGRRWWLTDPDGYAFISTGIDCVRPEGTGSIGGNHDLFEWLPDAKDTLFGETRSTSHGVEEVDFSTANIIRAFKKDWRSHWNKITASLLKKNAVNTIANWSDNEFAATAKIPYVIPLENFPSTTVKLFRDFPDVFDPEYKTASQKYAQQLIPFRDDKFLIGYFLDNEPHWAFGKFNIAYEMFGTTGKSYTKVELIKWLKNKYHSIEALNTNWNISLQSFQSLENAAFKSTADISDKAHLDLWEFSGLMVDKYLGVVCEEVKKVDDHHLNLGIRYAWISSDLCLRAANYFDVFSLNGYTFPGPPETDQIYKVIKKPIIIGEFHFGATDRGLPANGIRGTTDQKSRGKAYRYYVEHAVARPEIVGTHYFQWLDQPFAGRFDGENYNIGLLDVCYQPYSGMIKHVIRTNKRIYKIAKGKLSPYKKVVKQDPQIYY